MANIKKCILFEQPLPSNISRRTQEAMVHSQMRSTRVATLVIRKKKILNVENRRYNDKIILKGMTIPSLGEVL